MNKSIAPIGYADGGPVNNYTGSFTPSEPSMLPGIGSIISGVTGIGALIMNWWATNKQIEEQRAARAEAQKQYQTQQAEETRRWNAQMDMSSKQLAEQQKEAMLGYGLQAQKQTAELGMQKEQLSMQKEQNQWDRYLGIMQNMSSMMSTPNTRYGAAQQYRSLTNG